MPWLKKIKREYKATPTDKDNLRAKLYNNRSWKKLRESHLQQNPLCVICGNLATQVHHVNSPFEEGLNELERLERLLNPNNLESICAECHGKLHKKKQVK